MNGLNDIATPHIEDDIGSHRYLSIYYIFIIIIMFWFRFYLHYLSYIVLIDEYHKNVCTATFELCLLFVILKHGTILYFK